MSDLFPFFPRVPGYLWRATRAVGRAARKFLLYVLPPLLVIHIAATLITGRLVGKEMERLADAGQLLAFAEIAPPVPPEGENAADVYQQAFDSLRRSHEEEMALFWPDDPDDPEVMAVAREVVAANETYFDLLDRASRMPECAFPVDWERGPEATFPHWARMREAARMLAVRARVLNADGRHDEALADCATIFRLAEHAKAEPTIIAQLVALAIEGIADPPLRETLCGGSPSAEACRDTFDQFRPSAERPAFARAMEFELAMHLWIFDYVQHAPAAEVVSIWSGGQEASRRQRVGVVLYRTVGRPLLNLDQLASLQAWAEYFEALDLPWPESEERIGAATAAVEALPPWRSLVTQMVFPVYTRVVWTRDLKTAAVRAAQVALAVAGHRAEHGSYPDSLLELEAEGWELPTDPFGGGPFHYRQEGDGFVVWSIGPDMEDDNAARDWETFFELTGFEQREQDPYDYDVIFRCD
jgi:hypothetical protein